MPNPRLANRYAKSLVDLAKEQNALEAVYADMKYLQAICNTNKDFVNLLRSPIIQADKKAAILDAVTNNKIGNLTSLFNKLLINKGRENDLPEIATAFIQQYNAINGISKVKLTTATEVSSDLKNNIETKLKHEQGLGKIELETSIDEKLIGGFVLEFNNNIVDASIARDLRDVKNQFSKNLYINTMR